MADLIRPAADPLKTIRPKRDPTDEEVHGATIRELLGIPALVERSHHIRLGFVRPGSREASDRKSPIGEYPSSIANLKLAVAGDHLLALYNATYRENQPWLLPTWAHFSLLRGAIEGCADSRWLVDRSVSSAVRVARGLDRMLDDLDERAKAEESVFGPSKPNPPDLTSARTRILELTTKAQEAKVVRAGYPGMAQLIRTFATCGEGFDEYHYRFSSGILHGVAWAAISGAEKLANLDADVAVVRSTADPLKTWYLTRCAIRHFMAATATLEGYVAS